MRCAPSCPVLCWSGWAAVALISVLALFSVPDIGTLALASGQIVSIYLPLVDAYR
jgi:hypothetical protein